VNGAVSRCLCAHTLDQFEQILPSPIIGQSQCTWWLTRWATFHIPFAHILIFSFANIIENSSNLSNLWTYITTCFVWLALSFSLHFDRFRIFELWLINFSCYLSLDTPKNSLCSKVATLHCAISCKERKQLVIRRASNPLILYVSMCRTGCHWHFSCIHNYKLAIILRRHWRQLLKLTFLLFHRWVYWHSLVHWIGCRLNWMILRWALPLGTLIMVTMPFVLLCLSIHSN